MESSSSQGICQRLLKRRRLLSSRRCPTRGSTAAIMYFIASSRRMCLSTHHRNIRKLPLFCPHSYHCSMWEWRLPSKILNKNLIKPRLITIFVNRTEKNLVPRNFLLCEKRSEHLRNHEEMERWETFYL